MKKSLQFMMLLFSTISFGQTPIYQYNFNGSLSDANGVNTLTSNPNTALYVADRNGNESSAIKLLDVALNTNLANLPQGNNARTISFWFKSNYVSDSGVDTNWMFVYGSSGNGFGLYSQVYQTADTQEQVSFIRNYTYVVANNIDRIETPEPSGWHQYVVVHGYQGNANRGAIFVDGVLSVTLDRPTQLTTTGTNFSIGKEFGSPTDINVYMDDFQIYDVALTDAEIQTLYTNGSLTNPDFSSDNLKVSLFPNPASNSITIAMETELKSVEIYSILGQKVLSGSKKEINISTLLSGMYMVRVQDVDGGFATKKVVKE